MITRKEVEREMLESNVNLMMGYLSGYEYVTIDGEEIGMFECRGRTYFHTNHSSGAGQIADTDLQLTQAIHDELIKRFE